MKKLWKSLTPRLHFLPICSGRKIHQHRADLVHTKSFIGGYSSVEEHLIAKSFILKFSVK